MHMSHLLRRRRSIRLQDYDYAQAGAYFVTICTRNREYLFGEVVDAEMRLNGVGQMARTVWNELPARFPCVCLDAFIVMPNHIHGIIMVGAQFIAPDPAPCNAHLADAMHRGAMNRAPTLGEIVRAYKAASTRAIRVGVDPGFGWQRNYYEHIVRDEASLQQIREYVQGNPSRWAEDSENPNAVGAQFIAHNKDTQ